MEETALDHSAAKLQAYLLVQRRLRWARPPQRSGPAPLALLLLSLVLLWLTKLIVLDPLLSAA